MVINALRSVCYSHLPYRAVVARYEQKKRQRERKRETEAKMANKTIEFFLLEWTLVFFFVGSLGSPFCPIQNVHFTHAHTINLSALVRFGFFSLALVLCCYAMFILKIAIWNFTYLSCFAISFAICQKACNQHKTHSYSYTAHRSQSR